MVYTVFLDFEYNQEGIIRGIGKKITTPLFQTVLDLLSLDYEQIRNKLYEMKIMAGGKPNQKELMDILYNEHYLLTDELFLGEIGKAFEAESELVFELHIKDAFLVQIAIKAYLEQVSSGNSNLSDPDVFKAYVNNCLQTEIQYNYNYDDLLTINSMIISFDNNEELINEFLREMKSQDKYINLLAKSVGSLCATIIYFIFNKHLTIKRCKNCKKYFVPRSRADELYCDRISPQDENRTCKEYGSERRWYEELKNNPASKLHRKIYQAKQMLVKRNPDILSYKKDFEEYKQRVEQWKSGIKTGVKTEEEYFEWLQTIKGKRK